MMKKKGMLRLYQKFCRKCAIFRDSTAKKQRREEKANRGKLDKTGEGRLPGLPPFLLRSEGGILLYCLMYQEA